MNNASYTCDSKNPESSTIRVSTARAHSNRPPFEETKDCPSLTITLNYFNKLFICRHFTTLFTVRVNICSFLSNSRGIHNKLTFDRPGLSQTINSLVSARELQQEGALTQQLEKSQNHLPPAGTLACPLDADDSRPDLGFYITATMVSRAHPEHCRHNFE